MTVSLELSPCGKASKSRGKFIRPMLGKRVMDSQMNRIAPDLEVMIEMRQLYEVSEDELEVRFAK